MHVGYSEILIILVKSNLTFALGAKKKETWEIPIQYALAKVI